MCTFESRNTFYSPPFTNSDCSFWQSGWERFLFALGAKTALSDHPDIDPWCLGDLEMTSSECESKSQSREPLMWVWGFHLPQIGTPPHHTVFPALTCLWSDSFWTKANSSLKGPLFKWTRVLRGRQSRRMDGSEDIRAAEMRQNGKRGPSRRRTFILYSQSWEESPCKYRQLHGIRWTKKMKKGSTKYEFCLLHNRAQVQSWFQLPWWAPSLPAGWLQGWATFGTS